MQENRIKFIGVLGPRANHWNNETLKIELKAEKKITPAAEKSQNALEIKAALLCPEKIFGG